MHGISLDSRWAWSGLRRLAEAARSRTSGVKEAAPPISNLVLKTAVGVKRQAGVDIAPIRSLVDRFAADGAARKPDGDIVEFLWVEDIPQRHRAAFLAALAELSADDACLPASVLTTLDLTINRLRAERQSALAAQGQGIEYARTLQVDIDNLTEQKRQLMRGRRPGDRDR